MFFAKNANLFTIRSTFTRRDGYTEIESSKKINHKKAVQLLNSFTPQGASPKVSLRIGPWHNQIGLGYYFMKSDEEATISTIMVKSEEDLRSLSEAPMSEDAIKGIASGEFRTMWKVERKNPMDLVKVFGEAQTSQIVYSLLAGDNVIIIHPHHERRIEFLSSMMNIVPPTFFRYNRITTGCMELEGNENIIGVEKLPEKFRSHKKLYMPLDTVFIDLNKNRILGEGVKSNLLTNNVTEAYKIQGSISAFEEISNYFNQIIRTGFSDYREYGENTEPLTKKIRSKLGLEINNRGNWLMSF